MKNFFFRSRSQLRSHLPLRLMVGLRRCRCYVTICISFIIISSYPLQVVSVHTRIALGRLHATILNQDFLDTPDFSILQSVHLS